MLDNKSMVDYLLCADWSKEQKGRAVFVADVRKREVRSVRVFPLTVDTALARAREFAENGNVLLSFDVPLGLPHSFFSAIRNVQGWEAASSFTSFLPVAARTPTFFVSGTDASRWSLKQPFFTVPSGTGGKMAFERASAQIGVQLRRRIDAKTGGNPMFITAGIPGSVGSGAINAWIGLANLLPRARDFKIWPFEGTLPELFGSCRIVIAENYPRAIYAAAFSDAPAARRSRMKLSKTRTETRHQAIEYLLCRRWITGNLVTVHDTDDALTDENQFDALVTAAGLLRLFLDGEPLSSTTFEDPVAEGGILGTGTINFDLPEIDFTHVVGTTGEGPLAPDRELRAAKPSPHTMPGLSYRCPIPGCGKIFTGSRGGWDGHAGSFRMHPNWQPHITDHGDRLEAFRAEYPNFFD
jgi:hypothetical protein